jgi:hypothetical protein
MTPTPIANKYCEEKLKITFKREFNSQYFCLSSHLIHFRYLSSPLHSFFLALVIGSASEALKNMFYSEYSKANGGKGTTRNTFKGRLTPNINIGCSEVQNLGLLMLALMQFAALLLIM